MRPNARRAHRQYQCPTTPTSRASTNGAQQHEASYRRGYVTIAGLHALKEGANTAGSARTNDVVLPASVPAAIGRFVLTGDKVRYEPAPNALGRALLVSP